MLSQYLINLFFQEGSHSEMEAACQKVEEACSQRDVESVVLELDGPALLNLGTWKRMLAVITPAVHGHKKIEIVVADACSRHLAESAGFALLATIRSDSDTHS